ncbi:unnamed protein product [Sphenostylis stenocarpa]|uniref:LisH domain-containing protein n=1 Tax=Sphenostylis stenocarpa TaxID=92480 RepID=A0AA86SAL2_9FABA|nr:unnamed protein product [Sphenostylis stenocarpa]
MEPKAMASESFGRFNISPSQVASIIDHYLSANNFSLTRATFRMEASSLFANSPVNQISTPNEGTPPCKEIEEDWPPVKFLDSDIDDIDFSNLRTYLSDHEVAAHSKDNA